MISLNKALFVFNLLIASIFVMLICRRSHSTAQSPVVAETAPAKIESTIPSAAKWRPYSELKSSADWRQWLDQLRASNVPTPVLARLAEAGFEDAWQERQSQTYNAYMKGDVDTDGLAAFDIKHDREKENDMRAVLGDEDFKRYDMELVLRSLPLHDIVLSPSESNSLYEIEKKLQHQAQALNEMKLKGQIDPSDYEARQQKIQAERDDQVKALLGNQRFLAMYPPPNEAADELRKGLQTIEMPTNVSFNALVDIQNHWNERRAEAQARLQDAKTQIANSEDELQRITSDLDVEFARVLGTNATVTAQRESDPRYQTMKRYAEQWSLKNAEIDYVFRVIQYYEKARETYQQQLQSTEAKGEPVDWNAAKENIQQFGQLTQQTIQSYLGPSRFNQLVLNNLLPFATGNPASSN